MKKRLLFRLTMIAATLVAVALVLLSFHSSTPEGLPHTAFVERPIEETGAVNRVASVYLNYRLYDSLLEIIVFFVAVIGVRHYLGTRERAAVPALAESEVVRTSAALLFPLAVLLGIYLAALGHLSPGGGFGAGVIVASGVLLASIGVGIEAIEHRLPWKIIGRVERGALLVLLLLVLAPLAAGRPALSDLLPKGTAGTLLSGGMIPVYNLLIAVKVLAGSWLILAAFVRHRGEI